MDNFARRRIVFGMTTFAMAGFQNVHCISGNYGMESFRDELIEIISQESGLDANSLMAATGLMSRGLLDSFALVTVITFVEDQIGGEIPPSDLSFENFDSISGICAYVERSRAS